MSHYFSPLLRALQRTRFRLATEIMVMVGVLAFGALIAPAAAAPPAGTLNVEVVNPSESPVPVTGSVAAQVSGSVAVNNFPPSQTVNGSVNVSALPAPQVTNASAVGRNSISAGDNYSYAGELQYWPEYFTILTAESDQPGHLNLQTGAGEYFVIELPAGQNVTESFPFPLVRPQDMTFYCESTSAECAYSISAAGYNGAP